MDIPEIIPLPITPEDSKSLIPSAVKRSHPAFHDPRKEGGHEPGRDRKRKRSPGVAGAETTSSGQPDEETRGRSVDVHA